MEFEPRKNANYAAMIVEMMKCRWIARIFDIRKGLTAWESALSRYQMATSAILPDAVRSSMVAMHASPAVKDCLQLASSDVLVSYVALRDKILTYVLESWPRVR